MTTITSTQESTLTATVYAADGVLFVATAPSTRGLVAQIVGYIRERCDDVLWPSAAAKVRALIETDERDAAIATYFAHVGERWDAEWLEPSDPKTAHAAE
jgi:hypothetical protein